MDVLIRCADVKYFRPAALPDEYAHGRSGVTPPAAGKRTPTSFLACLLRTKVEPKHIPSIGGLDGFHPERKYPTRHAAIRNSQSAKALYAHGALQRPARSTYPTHKKGARMRSFFVCDGIFYSIKPLSRRRSSTSVPLTLRRTTRRSSFSFSDSLISVIGFLSIA